SRRHRLARDQHPPPPLAVDFFALPFAARFSLAQSSCRADRRPLAGCVIRSTTGQTVAWWQLVALIGSEIRPASTTSAEAPNPSVRPTICTALPLPNRPLNRVPRAILRLR